MPKLTISVAVHNLWETTQRCLESVFRYTEGDFDVVVTDNASGEETRLWLASFAKTRKNVRVVRNESNLGFSVPHNAAFAQADSEYFLVLNNDAELCIDWWKRMLSEFEGNQALAACGVRRACIVLGDDGQGYPAHDDEAPEYIEGSCLLVRSKFVRELPGGLFDPVYKFAYFEDSDLSLRIRKAGLGISAVNLDVKHLGARTAKIVSDIDLDGYKLRNRHVFLSRWSSYLKDRKKKSPTKDRIVVRRAGAQGDVILATPIIRALRRDYPNSTIVVETVCRDVLSGNPDVTEVSAQLKPRETDHVIDLNMAYERQPMRHPVEVYAEAAGVELQSDDDWRPRLYPHDTARIVAEQRMPPGGRYAIIHPGMVPGWVGRQWDIKRWAPVVADLHKRGYKTVVVGNDATPGIGATLDFRNVHFSHFAALMERAQLFLGLDSMPFHVAQAVGVPSVVIFGSVDPALRIVPGAPVEPVTAPRAGCLACHNWLPAPRTVTNSCLRVKEICMEGIDPGHVINAVTKVEGRLSK
jgi:GT2 family glycosyltransferase/ADP-heptose:LPS heptosyltransferase